MSTFKGVLDEYKLISIDCFLEKYKNYDSTTFFLSHCHTDHMRGLRDWTFFELLEKRSFSKIYLSDVSHHLLKNDPLYFHLSHYLVTLPLEEPTIVLIPDINGEEHSRVVVTLLTAGHCPGSVMFLIEGQNGTILYTGDFRLPIGGAARLNYLHDKKGCLKPLDSLYIDTTFCNRNCLYIPTREQCMEAIFPLVGSWLAKGSDHIICFFCPAQYAYEFVFVELFKRFGEKTHVTEEKMSKYKGIKIIEDAVTSIPWEARIHACTLEKSNLFRDKIYIPEAPCGYCTADEKPIKVRQIKPSAMFFKSKEFSDISHYDIHTQMFRVCYSTHSSLEEMRDMVKYLNPKNIYPNVVVKQTAEEILDLLQTPVLEISGDSDSETVSPLGSLKNIENERNSQNSTSNISFFDECYKIPKKSDNDDNFSFGKKEYPVAITSSPDLCKDSLKTVIVNDASPKSPSSTNEKTTAVSPLKWNYPSPSFDQENCDMNSYHCSSTDKSESESIFCCMEEQNIEILGNEFNTNFQSDDLKSKVSDIENLTMKPLEESSSIREDTNVGKIILKSMTEVNQQNCMQLKKYLVEKNQRVATPVLGVKAPYDITSNFKSHTLSEIPHSLIITKSNDSLKDINKSEISLYHTNTKVSPKKCNGNIYEQIYHNSCITDILSSIYNSDSENSEELEKKRSWRENKLVLDTFTNESTPLASSKLVSIDCEELSTYNKKDFNAGNNLKSSLSENSTAFQESKKVFTHLSGIHNSTSYNKEQKEISKEVISNPQFNNEIKVNKNHLSDALNSLLMLSNSQHKPCNTGSFSKQTIKLNNEKFKSNTTSLFMDTKNSSKMCSTVPIETNINHIDSKEKAESRISPIVSTTLNSSYVSNKMVIVTTDSKTEANTNQKCTSKKLECNLISLISSGTSSTTNSSLKLSNCEIKSNIIDGNLTHISEENRLNSHLILSSNSSSSNNTNCITSEYLLQNESSKNCSAVETSVKSSSYKFLNQSKHNNIFGSNFRRKHHGRLKSSYQTVFLNDSDEDVCVLEESKKLKANLCTEIINLSSDEEMDYQKLKKDNFAFNRKVTHQSVQGSFKTKGSMLPTKNTTLNDDSDVELLDDSPSLLIPKLGYSYNTVENSKSKTNKLLNSDKKRKSDEVTDFFSKKIAKQESESPDIFEKSSETDSTPDSLVVV